MFVLPLPEGYRIDFYSPELAFFHLRFSAWNSFFGSSLLHLLYSFVLELHLLLLLSKGGKKEEKDCHGPPSVLIKAKLLHIMIIPCRLISELCQSCLNFRANFWSEYALHSEEDTIHSIVSP